MLDVHPQSGLLDFIGFAAKHRLRCPCNIGQVSASAPAQKMVLERGAPPIFWWMVSLHDDRQSSEWNSSEFTVDMLNGWVDDVVSPTVPLYLQSLKIWQLWSWPWISPSPQRNFLHRSESLESMMEVHHQGGSKGTVNTSTVFRIWQTPNSNCDFNKNRTTNRQWKAKGTKFEGAHPVAFFPRCWNPIVWRASSSQWHGCPRFSPHTLSHLGFSRWKNVEKVFNPSGPYHGSACVIYLLFQFKTF